MSRSDRIWLLALVAFALALKPNIGLSLPNHDAIKASVKFDQSFYTLSYDSTRLTLRDGAESYSIDVKACNKNVTDKLVRKFHKLHQAYQTQKPGFFSEFDVALSVDNQSPIFIARGSDFGSWLRGLPRKIFYAKAEALSACRR